MGLIVTFKSKEPMSRDEYMDAIETVQQLVEELWPGKLERIGDIINEIKWCAWFSLTFRKQTSNEILEIIDWLYAETQRIA